MCILDGPDRDRIEDLIGTESAAVGEMLATDGWLVVADRLRKRIEQLRKFCSKRSHTKDLEEVRYLQGKIDAFEELVDFPQKLIKRLTS